jgi:hypothetical protein
MDKKKEKLKSNFTQIVGQISKFYKDISNLENESYNIGKKEAYEEILQWLMTNHNMEFKFISPTSFLNMLQEKLSKVKIQLNDTEETINLSEIKISENRKRIRINEIDPVIEENFSINNNLLNQIDINNQFVPNNLQLAYNPLSRKKKFK